MFLRAGWDVLRGTHDEVRNKTIGFALLLTPPLCIVGGLYLYPFTVTFGGSKIIAELEQFEERIALLKRQEDLTPKEKQRLYEFTKEWRLRKAKYDKAMRVGTPRHFLSWHIALLLICMVLFVSFGAALRGKPDEPH